MAAKAKKDVWGNAIAFGQGLFGDLLDEGAGMVAAANEARPPEAFGSDARSGKFAHLGKGDTPEERAVKAEAYTETRDAIRERADAAAETTLGKASKVSGIVAQTILAAPLAAGSYLRQVATSMGQAAASAMGAQDSGEGQIATAEEVVKAGGKGAAIGGLAGAAGAALPTAARAVGSTAAKYAPRSAGEAVDLFGDTIVQALPHGIAAPIKTATRVGGQSSAARAARGVAPREMYPAWLKPAKTAADISSRTVGSAAAAAAAPKAAKLDDTDIERALLLELEGGASDPDLERALLEELGL